MPFEDALLILPNRTLSAILWFVLLSALLYLARQPAHMAILSLTRAIYRGFRIAAQSIRRAEQNFALRNREVLLAHGREQKERVIEREFERIENAVQRDLADTPALYRRISEQITKIEEDHGKSTDVPPSPPGWVDAVKAVANINSKGDPMVAKILEVIHSSLIKAHAAATDEYRKATQSRHKFLNAMMPHVRKLETTLGMSDRNVTALLEKSKVIDRHMTDYEGILKKTDQAQRALSTSAFTYFMISALVLAIAAFGAGINFRLIARPMAEMVGGNAIVGGLKVSEVGALVIILLEVFTGVFLMESLRITNLFPVIGALKDSTRVRMAWFLLFLLTVLASIESGLALMREILVQDEQATNAFLRGDAATTAAASASFRWITTAAQMGLGFFLPFVLAVVAIPLETFFHTGRSVFGTATAAGMRGTAALLRVIGSIVRHLGLMLVHLYDVAAVVGVAIEGIVRLARRSGPSDGGRSRREPRPTLSKEVL
ncbi:MAG: hypothetical protein JSU82_17170 [Rhodospirillales bacterium]|nr:MAG: hypothetical protein JSU82_17170 [Rhodospirillales bacterium]